MDGRQFALQIRIGAFILAGLLAFFLIIYLLGAQARYFERKYNLVAEFNEVGGLIEGATVRLAGVQIGRVTAVALPERPGGKVAVTLTIARRFADRIRKNSEARIVTQGLLGDKLVEITIGSPDAPPLLPGESLRTQEPFELQQAFASAGETLKHVNELTVSMKATVERASRIVAEVETGKGLLHALVYDEPESLRRLNALLTSTQQLMAKVDREDNAVSVLLSPDSGKAARSLLKAMDAVGRAAEKAEAADGLLSALLFDPQYKAVAEDLRTVAHNFRDVSERLARGQGILGGLIRDQPDGSLERATADFSIAMANLRAVTDRLNAGEGTLGALLEDPTVYENLVQFLDGARRSILLRALIRSTIDSGDSPAAAKP